jgi:hypothetical protein
MQKIRTYEMIRIDQMAFNNDHTSKKRQPWSVEEHIFIQKLYNAASQDCINKINNKAFIQESMLKMGLKGRSWLSISLKLQKLIRNNWNFTSNAYDLDQVIDWNNNKIKKN